MSMTEPGAMRQTFPDSKNRNKKATSCNICIHYLIFNVMGKEQFLKDAMPLDQSQVLSDEMLSAIECGEKCEESCKKNCKENKKG